MPVREDGKWESWDTRKAREKFEAAQAADIAFLADEPADEPVEFKPQRRQAAAAQAAIADATGVEVTFDGGSTDDGDIPNIDTDTQETPE